MVWLPDMYNVHQSGSEVNNVPLGLIAKSSYWSKKKAKHILLYDSGTNLYRHIKLRVIKGMF